MRFFSPRKSPPPLRKPQSIFQTAASNTVVAARRPFNPYDSSDALYKKVGDNFVLHNSFEERNGNVEGEGSQVAPLEGTQLKESTRSKTARQSCTVVGNNRSVVDMAALSNEPIAAAERGSAEIHVSLMSKRETTFSCQIETPLFVAIAADLGSGKVTISNFARGCHHYDANSLRTKLQPFFHAEKDIKGLPVSDWIGDSVLYFDDALKNVVVVLEEVFLLKEPITEALRGLMLRAAKWARGIPRSAKVLKELGGWILAEIRYVFTLVLGYGTEEIVAAIENIDVAYGQNVHVALSQFELMNAHGFLTKAAAPPLIVVSPLITATDAPPSSKRSKAARRKSAAAARVIASTSSSPETDDPPLVAQVASVTPNPFADRACPFFWSTRGCDASRKINKTPCTPAAHRAVTGQSKDKLKAVMDKLGLTPSQDF